MLMFFFWGGGWLSNDNDFQVMVCETMCQYVKNVWQYVSVSRVFKDPLCSWIHGKYQERWLWLRDILPSASHSVCLFECDVFLSSTVVCSYMLLIWSMFFAALDGVHWGFWGVHPGSSAAGAERQPGDDAGLQTFHSGKRPVWRHRYYHCKPQEQPKSMETASVTNMELVYLQVIVKCYKYVLHCLRVKHVVTSCFSNRCSETRSQTFVLIIIDYNQSNQLDQSFMRCLLPKNPLKTHNHWCLWLWRLL